MGRGVQNACTGFQFSAFRLFWLEDEGFRSRGFRVYCLFWGLGLIGQESGIGLKLTTWRIRNLASKVMSTFIG